MHHFWFPHAHLKIQPGKRKKSLKHSCADLYKIKLVLPKHAPGCPENESMQTKTGKEKDDEKQNETTKADTI